MTRTLKTTGWILMMLSASAIALVSLRYFALNMKLAPPMLGEKFAAHLPMFLTHVTGGAVALLLGPWQFWSKLRNEHLALHRLLGKIYLLATLTGGIGGLYMAAIALGGLPARLGFAMLAALWLVTAVIAFVRIRGRDVQRHREWMIRNYSLTLAAVTLRLWLPLFAALGFEFLEAYITVAWFSWAPNLVLAEAWIGHRRAKVRQTAAAPAIASSRAA